MNDDVVCTCDDNCDSPCPKHARENELQNLWLAEKARAEKAEAQLERLRGELIPVGWEVLEQSGCPRCGDDVVAEPAMDGDGFLDGNPARCQSCGLPGQVVVDDEGASFSADDREWEIQKEVERAEKAEEQVERLRGELVAQGQRIADALGQEGCIRLLAETDAMVVSLRERAEKAEARLADYDTRLTAVMQPDFKDWHQNSRDEWPEVAAWVITNLRERIEETEKALLLIGEKAMVDFDDATVGQVDSVVKSREKYSDWIRKAEFSIVLHAELMMLMRKLIANEPMAAAMRFFDRETYNAVLAHLAACDKDKQ